MCWPVAYSAQADGAASYSRRAWSTSRARLKSWSVSPSPGWLRVASSRGVCRPSHAHGSGMPLAYPARRNPAISRGV
jgi:hypothetical protein